MDIWGFAILNGRTMVSVMLAKNGDSDHRQMLSDDAPESRNEKTSGGGFGNTTS